MNNSFNGRLVVTFINTFLIQTELFHKDFWHWTTNNIWSKTFWQKSWWENIQGWEGQSFKSQR